MKSATQFKLACPTIESFSPGSGDKNDIITVYGTYFASDISRIKVTVGYGLAEVINASKSVINARLGDGYSGKFPVKVQIEDKIAISSDLFTVPGPVITAVSSPIINGCEPVIISGSGFSPVASENEVHFNELKGNVISATPSQLVVLAPYNLKELELSFHPINIFVTVAEKTAIFDTPVTITAKSWKKIAPLDMLGRSRAVGFAIDGKGYVGTGTMTHVYAELLNDFWQYDSDENKWTRKADIPGVARLNAVGFNIGEKGYIGLGGNHSNVLFKDFWEYNSTTDSWLKMPDFPGEARAGAIGFSIAGNGYVGMGWGFGHTNDLWKFDPVSQAWTKETEYPGTGTDGMVCFAVGNKAYIGSGFPVNDFWEYTPATKQWRQLKNIPEAFVRYSVSFAFQDFGIMATGITTNGQRSNRVWKYDPSTDQWTRLPDFGGLPSVYAIGFPLENTFVIGTGSTTENIDETNEFQNYDCH
jgi:N-acetylneuraminic acid mutarotase